MDGKPDAMTARHGPDEVRRGDAFIVSEEEQSNGNDRGQCETSSAPDLERLRACIQKTEIELADTLNAIQEKLSLDHLVEKAEARIQDFTSEGAKVMKEQINRIADNFTNTASEAIRENPVPIMLAAMGIGWFLVRSLIGKSSPSDKSQRSSTTPAGLAEGVQISEAAPIAGHSADQKRSWKHSTEGIYALTAGPAEREQSQRPSSSNRREGFTGHPTPLAAERKSLRDRVHAEMGNYRRIFEDNPVPVAVSVLALGALVGLSIPRTKQEYEWLGEAGNSFVEKTREKTREVGQKARERVSQALHEAERAILGDGEHQHLTQEEARMAREEGWQP